MKRIKMYLSTLLVALLFISMPLQAGTRIDSIPIQKVPQTETTELNLLENRLEEIEGMDRSGLSFSERRALRKETRIIKGEIAELNGGVYLSVGAVVVIVLLLIILL